jgi:phosphoglycerate dehydrogenase-like enzyme
MSRRILLSANMRNPEFDSDSRRKGLAGLADVASVDYYTGELTENDADGVVGVIASSSLIHESFYEAAADLRIISRWGVGYEKVNLEAATRHGVIVTISPEHMVTVAEYAIAQWMATLKRVYTLNQLLPQRRLLSHQNLRSR